MKFLKYYNLLLLLLSILVVTGADVAAADKKERHLRPRHAAGQGSAQPAVEIHYA